MEVKENNGYVTVKLSGGIKVSITAEEAIEAGTEMVLIGNQLMSEN